MQKPPLRGSDTKLPQIRAVNSGTSLAVKNESVLPPLTAGGASSTKNSKGRVLANAFTDIDPSAFTPENPKRMSGGLKKKKRPVKMNEDL